MATKTFDELKQLAIQIRDEKTNKQNTANRVGSAMLEAINKLEQDYYNKTNIDEQSKNTTQSITSLDTKIDKRTTEYNVSVNNPTSGTNGGNKYDLSTAIGQVPAELRSNGLTISFLNESGDTEKWEFAGGSWAVSGFSQVGSKRIEELSSNIGVSFSKIVTYNKKDNYIINSKGTFGVYSAGRATDYIEVGDMKAVSIHNLISSMVADILAVAFYDENKTFISGIEYPKVNETLSPLFVVFPDNCKYFASSKQSQSNLDSIEIYSYTNYEEIEQLKSELNKKSDIGSVFGAQRVEADGSDTRLIFNNYFKEGDIIHLVNIKANANTYWEISGYNNGSWKTISSRAFAGQTVTKDVIIPSGIEEYDKIAVATENVKILSGYAYTITELTIQDIEKIKDVTEYTDELKQLPIIQQDVLSSSNNLLNPTIVSLLGNGWWVSDYIEVTEGEIYYLIDNENGCFTFDSSKKDVTSSLPFVSGEAISQGISFVRVKLGASGNTDEDGAMLKASKSCFSKVNEYSSFAKSFNSYLVDVIDSVARNVLSNLMPHQGKNLFCVGDSYTMQGTYFTALLAVTGLNKIGDTGGDGNGVALGGFPKNIIKYKEQILQCKFVTILGGTNDYGHGGGSLGTINDCIKDEYTELKVPVLKLNEEGYYVKDDSVDTTYKVLTEDDINGGKTPSSIYAAIMTCVNIIHSWDKTITVVLCSQPERLSYNGDVNPPSLRSGMNMDKIAKAMREIHEMFGVPYYDFHANAWTIDQVADYMNDGVLHPNGLGGEKLGRGLGMYINRL